MNRLRAIYGNEALMRKKGPRAKIQKKWIVHEWFSDQCK